MESLTGSSFYYLINWNASQEKEFESDVDLVQKIQNGDQRAETSLYEKYEEKIISYTLWKRTMPMEDAEEIYQDTMAAVIQNVRAGKISNPERLSSYVYGTCKHKVTDYMREDRGKPRFIPIDTCAGKVEGIPAPQPTEISAKTKELYEKVQKELTPREREIFDYRYGCEWSYEQIAEKMGISEENARQIVRRAKQRILKKIKF